MYIPKHFEEKDLAKIYAFMREYSFGTIVSSGSSRPMATHTPLILDLREGAPVIIGHISRGNKQKDLLVNGAEALCIFQGPHAYISPRWYMELNVPTWNYRAVQVYGTVKVLEGEDVRKVMSAMVDRYEAPMEEPMRMEEIPAGMLEQDLKGIHVFEIHITDIHAAEKLSQNRDEASYKNIINHLKKNDDFNSMLLAFEMERRQKKK